MSEKSVDRTAILDAWKDSGTAEEVCSALEAFGERVLEFQSGQSGTSMIIFGGTHGNEATGIILVNRLRELFESGTLKLKRGSLRLALGNPEAVKAKKRLTPGSSNDLNQSFTQHIIKVGEETSYEARRARFLVPYIQSSDITIDVHSTQKPTKTAFVSSKIDKAHERIYRWFREIAPVVIQDPNYVFAGEPASVDERADLEGNIGICLESGYAEDISKIDAILQSIVAIMADQKLIEVKPPELPEQRFEQYHWEERIPYHPERPWRWGSGVQGVGFEKVSAGSIIGFDGEEPILRDYDAFLLFPKTDELRVQSGLITYLARKL